MAISGRSSNAFAVTDTVTVGVAPVRSDPGKELTHAISWTDGDGASQVEDVATQIHTLTGGTDSVDLAGGFTRLDGTAITPTAIKALVLYAPAGNAGNVTVNLAGANGWDAALTGSVVLKPGSSLQLHTQDATGYAVTAGSVDLLEVTGTASDTLRIGFACNVA